MRIIFTDHAKSQLAERKLAKLAVANTVRNPTTIKKQNDGRFQFLKLYKEGNKKFLLITIVEKKEDGMEIVTVFKTSKIGKYL